MKVIVPTTITDALLTSSSVPEAAPAAYAGGTTYALGDQVSTGTVGGVITVYESLQAANTGHTPSSSPTWWKSVAETYSTYAAGTTYAAGDLVLVVATHKVYLSLTAGNVGNYPPTDVLAVTPKWSDQGATNRWRAFDQKVGVQVTQTGDMVYTFLPGIITALSAINVGGVSATLVMTDPTDGEVYNQTVDLIDTGNVFDAWTYFFAPFYTVDAFSFTDLPPYGAATSVLTIESDDTATCGEIVVGLITTLGETMASPELRIKSYSRITVDDFGNRTIVSRAYSKQRSFRVLVENYAVGAVEKTLAALRDTPVVWINGEDTNLAAALLVYGFFGDFRLVIPYPTASEMTLSIEGLT